MKIIVPMAGIGSRLRPHTLTVPKPLTVIAGKPIVQRLVEDITGVINQKIDEIAFIIGPTAKGFPADTEQKLLKIAAELGAKGSVYVQEEALGTAHAIYCAKESLSGPCVVAYADTLFKADFTLDTNADGAIWVSKVDNPSAFGVVKLQDGFITDFIEKPKDIGIYSILLNEWLVKPKKEDMEINYSRIQSKAKKWMKIIDGVIENTEDGDIESAKKLIKKYSDKLNKYRVCGLQKGGEYSDENLVFKVLRRNGYLEKIRSLKK